MAGDGAEKVRKTFLIFFTGRSGSGWLKDLCEGTGRLGRPGEVFAAASRGRLGELTLDAFVAKVVARNTRGGVFGAELTHTHLTDTFGSMAGLLGYFPAAAHVFLIREDIVLQSVSGTRKLQTRVGHSVSRRALPSDETDALFAYDKKAIKDGIKLRLKTEQNLEADFARHGMSPLRLSYERNIKSPKGALDAIARRLGEPAFEALPESAHTVLRTGKNEEFAARFRRENPFFMRRVERARAETLERLDEY